MTIDKQQVLNDLNFKESISFSNRSTPLMFSRDSSMDTLSSFNVNFHSHNSTYTSEHSTNPSGLLSPSDIPDSPPRGCDDDIEMLQHERQRSSITALNNTNSTGRTLIPRPDHFDQVDNDDDDDVERDSIRNYATSPNQISYHDDGDIDDDNDDNHSIHSSISSLTLPPPPSTSTAILLSNIHELRKAKHNLSVINEESFHEHVDRRTAMSSDEDQHRQEHQTQQRHDDEDEEEEDDDQRGKQLLFDLIRQRLPHHQLSLATSTESNKIDDRLNKSKSSSSSSCLNDQTMRDDSSTQETSAHDITIPSSAMQESGYDSLLPMGSAPKRSLSNASLSTTRSIIVKKKHRCDEENDDPMQTQSQTDMTDDDDEHYDKKAGEALLRNLIAQVLPSFNPRYLNGGDPNDDDGHDEMTNPIRRPSPMSQVHSSSTTSSVRSLDLDIEMTKKSEKNFSIRSTHHHINELIQQDKIHSKRLHIHKPVSQTKSSELRRLQNQTRR